MLTAIAALMSAFAGCVLGGGLVFLMVRHNFARLADLERFVEANLEKRMDSAEQAIGKVRERQASCDAPRRIADIERRIEAFRPDAIGVTLETISRQIGGVERKMEALSETVITHTATMDNLNQFLGNVHTKTRDMARDIADVRRDVDVLKAGRKP